MKLRGIPDSGLRRIAKKIGLFMVEPPVPQHEKYKGIIEYPGFHTTESFDIAASYAVGRVNTSYMDEDDDGINYVMDYPVVVALDMAGFIPELDYDAIEIVAPILEVQMDELLKMLDEDSTDDEIFDAAESLAQHSDDEWEMNDPVSMVSEMAMYNMKNPLVRIYDKPEFPDAVREYMRDSNLIEGPLMKMLMDATDQYRYTQDVSENRVVGVWFVTPIAEEFIDDLDEDNTEEMEAKWPGFDLFSLDEVSGGVMYNSVKVFEDEGTSSFDDDVQLSLFTREQLAVEPNIQYHGTTYKRLLEAAPFLRNILPEPPSPPYRG